MSEIYQPFREALAQEPQYLGDMFCAIDTSTGKMDEQFMDCVLGIPRFGVSGRQFPDEEDFTPSQREFSGEFVYEGTPYRVIKDILHYLKPTKDDVVYDIGAGYGRFCLYGALTTPATFKGIEIAGERHEKAQKIKDKFQIRNLEFLNLGATEAEMSDGTMFYMFNPFYPSGFRAQATVEASLYRVSKKHPITIVTSCMPSRFPIGMKKGFEKIDEFGTKRIPIEVFRSTPALQQTQ